MVLSFDGFATSPDGSHEWMFEFFGDDSGEWNRRALEEAGTHAMGRRSYEIMGPHWLAAEGPVATSMNEKPKAVFSRTLKSGDWGRAEFFGGDLGAAIAELKARDDDGTILPPWRTGLRSVDDQARSHRRVPAHLGARRDRRRPQPLRGSRSAPEAGPGSRATVRERRSRADSRPGVISSGPIATTEAGLSPEQLERLDAAIPVV